jgi:hypothetical protein
LRSNENEKFGDAATVSWLISGLTSRCRKNRAPAPKRSERVTRSPPPSTSEVEPEWRLSSDRLYALLAKLLSAGIAADFEPLRNIPRSSDSPLMTIFHSL